eukprot:TRINITY_DN1604_c0_g1_i1.p1 TRINITY_DN1604_c0_g1~~TRINITY_DN1604_c0_g1_i1.p1  ORF type:complete len:1238 (-),score=212.89 TRINITY_DN1604_c0_g1_i1:6350-10063(-)
MACPYVMLNYLLELIQSYFIIKEFSVLSFLVSLIQQQYYKRKQQQVQGYHDSCIQNMLYTNIQPNLSDQNNLNKRSDFKFLNQSMNNQEPTLIPHIAITVHAFEGEDSSLSVPINVCLSVDKQQDNNLSLETPSAIPLSETSEYFQILVTEQDTGNSLGTLSMKLEEIYRLTPQLRKHWVTLFEDPEDDAYDGDYMEDDVEVPRLLISYELQRIEQHTEFTEEKMLTSENEKENLLVKVEAEEQSEVSAEKTEEAPEKEDEERVVMTCSVETELIAEEQKMEEDSLMKDADQPLLEDPIEELDSSPHFGKEPEEIKDEVKIEVKESDISKNLIKDLTEQNKKLRDEVQELEDKKSVILAKLQAEVQDYDGRISVLLREKFGLKEKIADLERALEATDKSANNAAEELHRVQVQNENDKKMIEAEMAVKVSEYEAIIEEIKAKPPQVRAELTSFKKVDLSEYMEKVLELEGKYSDQVKSLQARLDDCNQKREDMLMTIEVSEKKEREMEDKIKLLTSENEALVQTREQLELSLKDTRQKLENAERRALEIEQKKDSELGQLYNKNIELTSTVEQFKAMLEEANANNSGREFDLSKKEEEIVVLKQENEAFQNRMQKELDLLKAELRAKCEAWESEKGLLENTLSVKAEELGQLQTKLQETQNELLRKSHVEDELEEKNRVIQSLEDIIREYKNANEGLKDKNAELSSELAKSKAEISELTSQCNQLHKTVTIHEEKIKKITLELTVVTKNLHRKESEAAENGEKLKACQNEVNVLKSQLSEKTEKVNELEEEQKKWTERLDDIAQKAKEIESWRLRSKNKEEKLQEISIKLIQQNKLSREFEAQLYQAQEELSKAKVGFSKAVDENEVLKKELVQAKKEIEELKNLLAAYKQMANAEECKECPIIYNSDKLDKVDQMFALYINERQCPVKLKKIGEGQYIFGTKKIFAKIQNERLVIRVGGGYMMIEDFLTAYTAQELAKIQRAAANEAETDSSNSSAQKCPGSFVKASGKEVVIEGEAEYEVEQPTTSRKKSDSHMVFLKSTNKNLSDKTRVPGGVSVRSKSPSSGLINGTHRTRVLTEQDLANVKMVKGGGDKVEVKVLGKKNMHSEKKGEGAENDSTLAIKQEYYSIDNDTAQETVFMCCIRLYKVQCEGLSQTLIYQTENIIRYQFSYTCKPGLTNNERKYLVKVQENNELLCVRTQIAIYYLNSVYCCSPVCPMAFLTLYSIAASTSLLSPFS